MNLPMQANTKIIYIAVQESKQTNSLMKEELKKNLEWLYNFWEKLKMFSGIRTDVLKIREGEIYFCKGETWTCEDVSAYLSYRSKITNASAVRLLILSR